MGVWLYIIGWVVLLFVSMANEWWLVAGLLIAFLFVAMASDGFTDLGSGIKIIGGFILLGAIYYSLQSPPPVYLN